MKQTFLAIGLTAFMAVVFYDVLHEWHPVEASNISQPSGAAVKSGVYASVPSCTTAQFVYITTDSGLTGYCNGSSTLIYKSGPMIVVPFTFADTAWFNQTSATIAADKSGAGVILTGTAGGAQNIQARVKATPSTPYTQIACFELFGLQAVNFATGGMFWSNGTNTSTSLLAVGELSFTTSGQIITGSAKYSNVTTFSANYGATSYAAASVVCMGLMDDGTTNRKIAISFNKQDWSVIHSVGRTDYLTPTEIGYYVNTLNSNTAPAFHLIDWETVGSALF